jgi:hypothetical protein
LVGEIKCHGPCIASEPQRCNLRFHGEPLEIGKYGRDELLPAWILRCQRSSKETEKIASLLGGLAPICCRCGEQMGFQFILPKT